MSPLVTGLIPAPGHLENCHEEDAFEKDGAMDVFFVSANFKQKLDQYRHGHKVNGLRTKQ